jgi:hypothetical protein
VAAEKDHPFSRHGSPSCKPFGIAHLLTLGSLCKKRAACIPHAALTFSCAPFQYEPTLPRATSSNVFASSYGVVSSSLFRIP